MLRINGTLRCVVAAATVDNGQTSVTPSSALFRPISIGRHIHLPNRFMMQPMYLNMERELNLYTDEHMDAMAAFFGERAYYGAKLIVVGGLSPSFAGKWAPQGMSLSTLDAAKSLRKVTNAIHREGGYVLAQAFNAGRSSRNFFCISPTSVESKVVPVKWFTNIRLPGLFVNYIVSEYQRFAKLAEEAGFDGVEVPVSEGTLLHNFLSAAVNDRTDAFGGSLEKRLEIVIRVLEEIKEHVFDKENFVVSVRLCLHDLKLGGTPMAETLLVAETLARSGYVDLLNTSVGMHDSPVQTMNSFVPQGAFARCCQLVKERLTAVGSPLPVVASHRIHSVAVAERLMERHVCDMVGIARPLLADAQFIRKAQRNEISDIAPCIACNHCVNRLYKHQRVTCALNPVAGYELERIWRPSNYKRHIAVVGDGAAGVTCALTLWRRGHDVTLYEKNKYIGGQLNLAKMVPGKQSYQSILEYWTRQLRESSVNVQLETEFTQEEMTRQHNFFHAVVLCSGSIPKPITSHKYPGASENNLIVSFERILDGTVKAGRRVVLLGNGAIAHDVASYLLHDQRVSRSVEYFLDEWGVDLDSGRMVEQSAEAAPKNNRGHYPD
ncbi:2,4-dienoyl-CoA reductase (NADPH2) [Angomonas deanei]|nr:2,4-dienoyl-CoA reductase (NADPH2) [Angomonas deanei]|eukprot:EPY26546.1 2,4-dienoyl-CoA reductase (NADPH2) [Angomonas deanei]